MIGPFTVDEDVAIDAILRSSDSLRARQVAGRSLLRLGMYAAIGAGASVFLGPWLGAASGAAAGAAWTALRARDDARSAREAWREWLHVVPGHLGPFTLSPEPDALVWTGEGFETRLGWAGVTWREVARGVEVIFRGTVVTVAPPGTRLEVPTSPPPVAPAPRERSVSWTATDTRAASLARWYRQDPGLTPLRSVVSPLLALLALAWWSRSVAGAVPLAYGVALYAWERTSPALVPLLARALPRPWIRPGTACRLDWDATGFTFSTPEVADRHPWSRVTCVDASDGHTIVEVDHVFPYFAPPEVAAELRRHVPS